MADNKVTIKVLGEFDKKTTQIQMQSQLNDIGKNLKTNDGIIKSNSEYKKQIGIISELNHLFKTKQISDDEFLSFAKEFRSSNDWVNATWQEQEALIRNVTSAEKLQIKAQKETIISAKASAEVYKEQFKLQKQQEAQAEKLIISKQKLIDTLEVEKIKAKQLTEQSKNFGTSEQHAQVEKYNQEIQKLSVSSDMTEDQIAQMNKQLKISKTNLSGAAKEARALGNNSMTMGNMMKTAIEKFAILNLGLRNNSFLLTWTSYIIGQQGARVKPA